MAWTDEQKIATTQIGRGVDQTVQPVVGDILVATASGYIQYAISVPGTANFQNVFGVNTSGTTPTWLQHYDDTNPSTSAVGASASPGTSIISARRDHTHGREAFGAAGYPADVAVAESDGVATTLPRSDHAHAHGTGYAGGHTDSISDHGALTGLTPDDDHTQYALLAGRSGGQTLNGGTAASENLVLQATSHATPGILYLGSTQANAPRVLRDIPSAGHNVLLVGSSSGIGWNDGSGGIDFRMDRRSAGFAGLNAMLIQDPTVNAANSTRYTAQYTPSFVMTGNNVGLLVGALYNVSVSGAFTLTNLVGAYATVSKDAATTVTNSYLFYAPSNAIVSTNTWSGYFVGPSGANTKNVGVEITAPSNATSNYALQLSDTGGTAAGGITFGTDVQIHRDSTTGLSLAAGTARIFLKQSDTGPHVLIGATGTPSDNVLLLLASTLTPATGDAFVMYSDGMTLAPANGANAYGLYGSCGTVVAPAGETITGAFAGFMSGASMVKSGTGAITFAFAAGFSKPTLATNNYFFYLDPGDLTDPTGAGGAAAGRIPIYILGDGLRYLAYY